MAVFVTFVGVLDTNIRVKPETQNVRKLVDATGTTVTAPTAFSSTRVTSTWTGVIDGGKA